MNYGGPYGPGLFPGLTNVWSEPPIHGIERIKTRDAKAAHANQKPLSLIERIIAASSDAGDTVWEPFGGLCSASVVSLQIGRKCFSAEIHPDFYHMARNRLLHQTQRLF